jgi:hypothetical protein
MRRGLGNFLDVHPKWDYDKFLGLCKQVCHGKTTQLTALRKYCPRTKS